MNFRRLFYIACALSVIAVSVTRSWLVYIVSLAIVSALLILARRQIQREHEAAIRKLEHDERG